MGAVLAPLNGKGRAQRLLAAGADELYLGFYDQAWTDAFGGAPLNRMSGFGPQANSLTFEEALDEVARVRRDWPTHAAGRPNLYCVFNAMHYTPRQRDFIERAYLPGLAQAGVDGVIVSGPELAWAAHACGLQVVASTMAAAYSSLSVAWLAEQGVDRVILPRDLSSDDIAAIVGAVPHMRYEVFLMRNGCVFADSHCMGLHRAGRPSVCRSLRESPFWRQPSAFVRDTAARAEEGTPTSSCPTARLWAERFHLNACGLCALWRFERLGIEAYKVVGRGDAVEDLAADVGLVARNVALARACATEQEYLRRMERPEGILQLCDNEGLSCYYPEVRFG